MADLHKMFHNNSYTPLFSDDSVNKPSHALVMEEMLDCHQHRYSLCLESGKLDQKKTKEQHSNSSNSERHSDIRVTAFPDIPTQKAYLLVHCIPAKGKIHLFW